MSEKRSTWFIAAGCLCVVLLVSSALADPKHCAPVGGAFMTNLGGFGENTTLGVITGDIKGAVGVQILGMTTVGGTTSSTTWLRKPGTRFSSTRRRQSVCSWPRLCSR